jgi:hypothetical protein
MTILLLRLDLDKYQHQKIERRSNIIKGEIQHDKTFAAAAATANLKKFNMLLN